LLKNKINILEKIRSIRLAKGYTQEYIAAKLNIDTVNYGRIERGQSKLTVDRFIELCKILEVSPNIFFKESIEESNNSELYELTAKIYEEIKQINKKIN